MQYGPSLAGGSAGNSGAGYCGPVQLTGVRAVVTGATSGIGAAIATALLAEAQLLEMEPLAPDHREAVRRIIDLSRRLAAILRRLDLPRAR